MSVSTESAFEGTGRPTRTSAAITAVVTAVVVALLLGEVRLVVWPALVGCAGAACFAASLWLLSLDRGETVASVLVSLLTVCVAVGLLVGLLGTVLLLVGSLFPVPRVGVLSARTLFLVSRVGIVFGCVLAVLGVLLGLRSVVDTSVLSSYFWLGAKASLVPTVVSSVLVTGVFLTQSGAETPALLVAAPAVLSRWLLTPTPDGTHLATLASLVAVGALGVRAAVGALPIAELLADSGSGETDERRVDQVRTALGWIGGVALVVAPIAFVTEFIVGPPTLRRVLGPAVYRPLVVLSTASPFRVVLVAAACLAVPTVALVRLLRRAAQGSVTGFVYRIGPFVGGAIVTAGALVFARPVVSGLLGWVTAQLPGPFAPAVRGSATALVEFFGAPAIVVFIAAVLIGVTATVALGFRFALFAGYLTAETAGYSLASGGLFLATAFAGTAGASPWLVFGGLVGSFLVWDTGRYGTTLGAEIGRHAPTRDGELVHAGGTLAVGLVGTGLAYAISTALESGFAVGASTSLVALLGVLVGIVSLIVALR